jgi:hypothetical protein
MTRGAVVVASKTVKRRMTWMDVIPMPGNPIYEGRLARMDREFGGYAHEIVGSPAIFLNDAGAFPELPLTAQVIGDGNHRRALAERHDALDHEFLADLYRGMTRPEVYRLRRGLNDRRTVKPAEKFIELVEEGDPTRRALTELVEGVGWHISHDRELHGLPCTNELMWIYARRKGAVVRAIQTYEQVWGVRGERAQARVIKGLGAFWIKYPEADLDRLVASLKGVTVEELYRAGRNQNTEVTFIKGVYDGIRFVAVMHYNRGRRRGTLPI